MSNHTPGPWQVKYDELTEEWLVFWKRGYASVGGFNNTYNAHLIAAAPEILETLEVIAKEIQIGDGEVIGYLYGTEILEVIAKAKGETE